MPLTYNPESKLIVADGYRVQILQNSPYISLSDHTGQKIADLFPFSSVHSTSGLDDTTQVSSWKVTHQGSCIFLECTAQSSIWESKVVWFKCYPDQLQYGMRISGQGKITDVHYFGGYNSSILRWGSGYFESGSQFLKGFTPGPNVREHIFFSPDSSARIDLTGVPVPGRDGWFFTPPPFCFSMQTQSGWISLGVECQPGQNRYSDYQYIGGSGWFHLSLSYDGYTQINGEYELPVIGIGFADDPYQALQLHVASLRRQSLVPSLDGCQQETWWRRPIFCGWGAQCNLAAEQHGRAPDFATQENYEFFLHTLDEHQIHPGTLVIDDKWQAYYGDNSVDIQKWPDLKGFIRSQHQNGRKVLLWLKFWDPDGLPADECVTNACGKPVSVDPTNPRFIQRYQASVFNMLAPAGLNADGFKVDFSARIPSGPGMKVFQDVWGLELMRAMLELLYKSARAVKPDALVITHTPHPYLAPYLDMIRLNDINKGADVIAAMRHRQKVVRIACPEALIDTDNWPITNKSDWLAYTVIQPELGVPALYYTTHIDATHEALTDEDYDTLRVSWQAALQRSGMV